VTAFAWTCTACGVSASDLEHALRRMSRRHGLALDGVERGHDLVLERSRVGALARARVAMNLPIPNRDLAKALAGICVVEESSPDAEEVQWRLEMVVLGGRAFVETFGERGATLQMAAASMRIVAPTMRELRGVRAGVRRLLAQRIGPHVETLLGLDANGSWVVAPGVDWEHVRTLPCRDPASPQERLFAAALAQAPPGLAEAAGWPPQRRDPE
jgi:hypothetical protein